ncbi:MAG: YtxH domain-containing protein [Bacilli bacterium]|uniref:YtxH domain-containing protein n=1 Tax=Ureibacillus suwonensis TaxID=313007 RepID=A0ABW0RGD2_9BACL|nr:YtxH domain-containing protein [Bacilli bacterium]
MPGDKTNFNEVKDQQAVQESLVQETREEETINMKDFVIGALVGGIVGAAVGLLLAPKTGKDLRSDVLEQASNIRQKGIVLTSTAKEKTAQLSSQIKEQSSHLVDKVKSKKDKSPQVFDDGTVSYEENLNDAYDGADISEVARPSSI